MYSDVSYLGPVLTTVGLVLDIFGVCVLTRRAIITKKEADELAATAWNKNLALERALWLQSKDARLGLQIIIFGFAVQIVGTWLGRLT